MAGVIWVSMYRFFARVLKMPGGGLFLEYRFVSNQIDIQIDAQRIFIGRTISASMYRLFARVLKLPGGGALDLEYRFVSNQIDTQIDTQ